MFFQKKVANIQNVDNPHFDIEKLHEMIHSTNCNLFISIAVLEAIMLTFIELLARKRHRNIY